MPKDNGLKNMIKQLHERLAEYDEHSAIFIDVRIFDTAAPQEELAPNWTILHDNAYGRNNRHRLKIGHIPKGVPKG